MWTSPITWALLFLGAVFAFAIGANIDSPLRGSPVTPFTLHDSSGKSVSSEELKGKTSLLYFGFTFCPDVCPNSMRHISDALLQLEQAGESTEDVQVWFISVDPQRDTPEVLNEFATLINPQVRAMTGTSEQLTQAKAAFGIVAEKRYPAGAAEDFYLIDHTASTMLVNSHGELVDRIPYDTDAAGIAARIRAAR